jgi:hypothetical protein
MAVIIAWPDWGAVVRATLRALSPLGAIGEAVFIVGVIGSGLLALPVLAGSTAYAVAEVFGWPEGLGSKAAQAHRALGQLSPPAGDGRRILFLVCRRHLLPGGDTRAVARRFKHRPASLKRYHAWE